MSGMQLQINKEEYYNCEGARSRHYATSRMVEGSSQWGEF
jgi:hypothetical protein